ncbi:unnamed protein product [Paramecium sonneborni]|uniref:Uncharacterized protein n=1 Tax=Paramecium sonneborni TaxID=65129 RepID=A0A8S1N8S4_9CILI|nr:unnamed protein product [Paramecium sonneborni]
MSENQENSFKNQELSYLQGDQKFLSFERALSIKDFVLSLENRDYENEFGYLKQITQTREHDRKLYRNSSIQHLNRYSDILPCTNFMHQQKMFILWQNLNMIYPI